MVIWNGWWYGKFPWDWDWTKRNAITQVRGNDIRWPKIFKDMCGLEGHQRSCNHHGSSVQYQMLQDWTKRIIILTPIPSPGWRSGKNCQPYTSGTQFCCVTFTDHLLSTPFFLHTLFFFKKLILIQGYFYWVFREREREIEKKRETLMWEKNIDWLPPICALTRHQTCNLGICPDQNQTCNILVYRTMIQLTESPSQGSWHSFFLSESCYLDLRVQKHKSHCKFNCIMLLGLIVY